MSNYSSNPVIAAHQKQIEKSKPMVWAERTASKSRVFYAVYMGKIGTDEKTMVGGATTTDNLRYKMRCAKVKYGLDPDSKHIVINIKRERKKSAVAKSDETVKSTKKTKTPIVTDRPKKIGKIDMSKVILSSNYYN
jgi:hypothetical protein